MRLRLLPLLLAVACGTATQGAVAPSPSPSPTSSSPSPTSSSRAASGEVALPTCLEPRVRPDWWTGYCGDAGLSYDLTWDTWTPDRATGRGSGGSKFPQEDPWRGSVRVVADRPRLTEDGGRVFTRLVVTYDGGEGPDGVPSETYDTWQMWTDHVSWRAQPTEDPCPTPESCATG